MLPSSDYQQMQKTGLHTDTQLPRSVDGGILPAIYPKNFTDLAENATSTPQDMPRAALLYTSEGGVLFSISKTGSDPFCPLPAQVLLLISIPAGESVKASKTVRVVWL